jgi:ribosome-associated protein
MPESANKLTAKILMPELVFTTSRSGGPGGQHVNKVNTKVTLRWDVKKSALIDEDQRALILNKLAKVINSEGELVLSARSSRSQLQNKEEVLLKLDRLLEKAFWVAKARKATKPSKASVKKRLEAKKRHGEKKRMRRDPD